MKSTVKGELGPIIAIKRPKMGFKMARAGKDFLRARPREGEGDKTCIQKRVVRRLRVLFSFSV